jgi:hypothetical protein
MAIADDGGFIGRKCRKPFKPNTMKINANKYRAMREAIFIKCSFFGMNSSGDDTSLIKTKARTERAKPCSIAVADVAKEVRFPRGIREKDPIHLGEIAVFIVSPSSWLARARQWS